MEITVLESGPLTVVAIRGSVDGMTAGALTDALAALVKDGKVRMVADFTGVDYISSAGLRALLGAMKDARHAGGDFRLAAVRDDVRRVLELSGFLSILKAFPDVEGALLSFTA